MPWSSLGTQSKIQILIRLLGGAKFREEMDRATASTGRMGTAADRASVGLSKYNRQSFIAAQRTFTLRRLMFYNTLALGGMVAGVVKLGFEYNNTLQQSRLVLGRLFTGKELDSVINRLYRLATLSPFLFKDTTQAFRQMYVGFRSLGLSADFTITTIQSLMDALTVAGKVTPAALNRVSVALQHMAFMGRPMGFTITQLARDGIPIFAALHKQLHLTDRQIKSIANSGLTAKQVISAFNRFIQSDPAFAHAAARVSNLTLQGAWAQFKDILSQGAGGATFGMFRRVQSVLTGVNLELRKPFLAGKPITITQIAEAFDKQLTPNSHAVINTFIILSDAVKTVATEFFLLFKAISIVLYPINKILGLFGGNRIAAHLLGIALGTLITLWTIMRVRILLANEAMLIFGATEGALASRMLLSIKNWKTWAFMMTTVKDGRAFGAGRVVPELVNTGVLARMSRWLFLNARLKNLLPLLRTGFMALSGAVVQFTLLLATNPILLVVTAIAALMVGLVILYFRWKKFHDLVNKTAHWFYENWYWAGLFISVFLPILGPTIYAMVIIVKNWERLTHWLKEAYKWMVKIKGVLQFIPNIGPLAFAGMNTQQNLSGATHREAGSTWKRFIPGYNLFTSPLGTLRRSPYNILAGQHGGIVPMHGARTLVGERGPEILSLPGRSRITPMSDVGPLNMGIHITVVPQAINLNGKKIAQVLADVITDKEARQ